MKVWGLWYGDHVRDRCGRRGTVLAFEWGGTVLVKFDDPPAVVLGPAPGATSVHTDYLHTREGLSVPESCDPSMLEVCR
jgi:hypothetical protein